MSLPMGKYNYVIKNEERQKGCNVRKKYTSETGMGATRRDEYMRLNTTKQKAVNKQIVHDVKCF